MLRRLMSWGESRIKPFEASAIVRPPERLLAFYWFFIKPLWPYFLLLLIAGCLGSTIEVALMGFIGAIVDKMRTHGDPSTFVSTYGWMLAGMALVALILRPLVSMAHDFIKNQMLSAGCTSRVRWQTHRYVLRQ